jgi:ArsR family transcriptional regulator
MPRISELAPARLPGERCCDPKAASRLSAKDAERFVRDLEILSNPIRLQLLDTLARNEGMVCVCDLEAAVPVKQPTVSHHLKLLREAGLVGSEKRGLWAYYHVNQPALQALRARIERRLASIG